MKPPFKHVPPHDGHPDVGSHWAYRTKAEEPLIEVEILRLGVKTPARVKVRFVDEDQEGREDWVPPARLKVSWSEVKEFEQREERWRRLNAVAYIRNDPRGYAAWEAIEMLVPDGLIASVSPDDHGVSRIRDVVALASFLGLDPDDLVHPLSFVEEGELLVPWPITLMVATTAVSRDPDRIAKEVSRQDQLAAREAIYGDGQHSAETLARVDENLCRPIRDVLRQWAGNIANDKWTELAVAQAEARRLRKLLEDTVEFLRIRGHHRQAKKLLDGLPRYTPE